MRSVRALASVIARTASPASASASNTASSAKCSVQFPTSRVLAPTNVQLPPWSSARSFSTRGLISYPNTSTRVNGPIAAVINLNAHAYSKGNMGLAPVGMSLHARGMSSWFGFGKKKTEDVEPPPSSHDASSTSDGSSIEQIASATGDVGDASSSVTTTGLEAAQAVAGSTVLADATPLAQSLQHVISAPGVSEVSALASEHWYNVWGMMHALEGFHQVTGLPWWLTIVASTITLRTCLLPVFIMTAKNTAKLTLARPEMEANQQAMNALMMEHKGDSAKISEITSKFQTELWALYKKYDCNPLKSFVPLFVQGFMFISLFFSLQTMSAEIPSFVTGGTSFFTDLSTSDKTLMMPLATSALFLLTVEVGAADGMEGNPYASQMKTGLRFLAVALVPLTMSMSKGIFCYWIANNTFSLFQGTALKQPGFKKLVGIPETKHLLARKGKEAGFHPTDNIVGKPKLYAKNPKSALSKANKDN